MSDIRNLIGCLNINFKIRQCVVYHEGFAIYGQGRTFIFVITVMFCFSFFRRKFTWRKENQKYSFFRQ